MATNQVQQTSMPSTANIARVELDNGMVVLVYENPAVQSVNIMGSVHAGSIYETPEKNGLSSFVATALMRGTSTRNFDEIHGALEDIGADVSYQAHTHKIGVTGKSLAEDLPTLFEIVSDTLRNATFPSEQMERLRGERMTWLQYSEFNTRYRASKAMREALYPASHPYHYGTYGTVETLPGLTVAEMQEFYAKHYGPKGMILVVVGAVTSDEVVELAQNHFADWRNPDQPPIADAPELDPVTEQRRTFAFVAGKTQSDISMGSYGPSRYAPDYVAAQLANSVLGEFGMMGRIGKSVREEKGLAYYAYSRISGGHGPGEWSISAGVNPENVELAVDSSLMEIERLATEEVSDEDIADNQSYFAGRLPLRLESNEGLASHIHSMESYNLGLDYLANYKDMIYAITKQDMLDASKKYLDPQKMVIGVAGPEYVTYKQIHAWEAVPVRMSVMRPEAPREMSLYPLDEADDALHVGAIKNGELVGIASVFREDATRKDLPNAWRLRGMATVEAVRGEGHGKALLDMIFDYIAQQGGGTLWCNARLDVTDYYESAGFVVEGEPYDLEGHGQRVFMWREIEAVG